MDLLKKKFKKNYFKFCHGIQKCLMSSVAWKEALNIYRNMHPDHFSNEDNEFQVFAKGTNPTWKSGSDF